jgi:pimeloyl-ACP methyl ester carboxylesterase
MVDISKIIEYGLLVLAFALSTQSDWWSWVGKIGFFLLGARQLIQKLNLLAIQPSANAYTPINRNKTPADEFASIFPSSSAERYSFESHQVLTKDGTILLAHRVNLNSELKAAIEDQSCVGKVALLVHSMNCCSEIFFLQGNGNNMGTYWVEKGYDVWLTNQRGNRYSLDHKDPNITAEKFFDYSIDQYALDIEAYYKFIEGKTQCEKITYVSYSLGGYIFSLSHSEEKICKYLNSKTERAVLVVPLLIPALAKVEGKMVVPQEALVYFKRRAYELGIYGYARVVKTPDFSHMRLEWEVNERYPAMDTTQSDLLQGNPQEDNMWPVIKKDLPAIIFPCLKWLGFSPKVLGGDGVTVKVNLHLYQGFSPLDKSDLTVKKFDHGEDDLNSKAYGQIKPPAYDFGKIGVKVDVICGSLDFCCNNDAALAYKKIVEAGKKLDKPQVDVHVIPEWKHFSFALPKDHTKMWTIFDKILENKV